MIPPPIIAAGIAAILAFGGGWKLRDYRATAEKLQQERATTEYLSRNMVNFRLAQQALQAVEDRSNTALQEALNAPRQKLDCPPGADVRDVLLPDLGQRLRLIRESSGQPAGPFVAPVPVADTR